MATGRVCDEDILDFIFDPIGDKALLGRSKLTKKDVQPIPSSLPPTLRDREVAAIRLAEAGKLEESLSELLEVLKEAPTYAAGYNNVAQVQRLLHCNEDALKSLNEAIRLAGEDQFTYRQSLTQRGMLYLLMGDEDKARPDFEAAAALGSDLAAKEAAKINPYARMCNAMLQDVFEKYSWSQASTS